MFVLYLPLRLFLCLPLLSTSVVYLCCLPLLSTSVVYLCVCTTMGMSESV